MSGFSPEDDYRSDEAQLAAAAGGNTVASLQAGHPFSLLLTDDDAQRETLLEATLDTVADTGTRFTRATNPLRARLTLERLLIQVVQGPLDLDSETAAELVRRIAYRQSDEVRVILVIERAESLHPEVLRFLGDTASMFPDEIPRLQVLFVGRPEFQAMLEDPGAGLDEQTQLLESYRPSEVESLFASPPDETGAASLDPYVATQPGPLDQFWSVWQAGLTNRIAILGGSLIGLAAIVFAIYIAVSGEDPPVVADTGNSALMELPEPAETDPDPPVLQAGPAQDAATAQLRSEFESYLVASGRNLENATQAQKRTIYQEFIVWRARTTQPKAP